MLRQALLLTLVAVALSVDYCEVSSDTARIFIQGNETRLLDLNSYVRGYDLSFTADSPAAQIHSSYELSVN